MHPVNVPAVFMVMAVLALQRIGIVAEGYATAPAAESVVLSHAPELDRSIGIVAVRAVFDSSV